MKFNINNYKGNYAMHCVTEEEAREFCNYLHSIGKRWSNNTSYLESTYYDTYFKYTVYFFNEGTFGSVEYARDEDYTILEFSNFDWTKEFTKADLKTGDVVLRRGGAVEIVNRDLEMLICQNGGWNDLDNCKEDLTYYSSCFGEHAEYDIIQVRRPKCKGDCCFDAFKHKWGILVYKREEPEEMTLEQVCALLGKKIKIIG